jgi:hypothetical protein
VSRLPRGTGAGPVPGALEIGGRSGHTFASGRLLAEEPMLVNFNLLVAHKPVDDGLRTLLYLLQAESRDGVNHQFRVGDMYISPWTLQQIPHPVIAAQCKDFAQICSAVLGVPITLTDVWFNIYHSGSALKRHNHYMNGRWVEQQFGLVYYVSRGDDNGSGQLRLYNPDLVIHPQDGMLVMFPGTADHEVLEYRGESDRVVISANFLRSPVPEARRQAG